jgi:hypothetical protein
MNSDTPDTAYFSRPLLYQLVKLGLLDEQSALGLDQLLHTKDWIKVHKDATIAGLNLKVGILNKWA